ncbi:MAG: hypothetical protein ABJH05_09790 [Fulvivirga sp.]
MKKIILLIAMGAFFISTENQAQQFVASFGTYHHWGIPDRIQHTIAYDYYNYDLVHVNRVARGGYLYFDVLLQRGNVFVEVNIGTHGRIIGRTYFDRYPLHNHICSSHCGYHATYYNTYRQVCSSHNHHGHNHVAYKLKSHKYNNGYAYGHHKKGHKKHYKSKRDNVYYPVRRSRYHDTHDSRNKNYVSRSEIDRHDSDRRGDRRSERGKRDIKSRRDHHRID